MLYYIFSISEDFEWLKMIRYYWEDDIDNCVARMSNAMYIYGHEYLGAGGKHFCNRIIYLSTFSILDIIFKTIT